METTWSSSCFTIYLSGFNESWDLYIGNSLIYIVFITSIKIKTRVSGVRVWWTFVTLVIRYQILPSKLQWMIHWQIQRRCLSNDWNRSLAWPDHIVETAYRTGRWGTDAGPWQTGSVTPRVRTSVNTKHQIGKHHYISIENTGIFINNEFKKKTHGSIGDSWNIETTTDCK